MIRYYACKPIATGEELCIYYGSELWFEEAAGGEQDDGGAGEAQGGEGGDDEEGDESDEDEEGDGGAAFRAMMLGDLPADTLAALNATRKS